MLRKVLCVFMLLAFVFTFIFAEVLQAFQKQDEKPRIAILPFADTNSAAKREGNGEAISGMLMTELINGRVFQVVERNEINRIMEEIGLSQTGAVDMNTAKNIGQIYGVDILVFGNVAKFGSLVETDIRLVETERGEALMAESANSQSEEEIRTMVIQLAAKINQRYLGVTKERVQFKSSPNGARIYVDDSPVGKTPIEKNLSTGTHRIRIVRDDYEPWEDVFEVKSGTNYINAQLKPMASTSKNQNDGQAVRSSSGGGGKGLYIVLGALVIGGGVAAFLLLKKKNDDEENKNSEVTVNVTMP